MCNDRCASSENHKIETSHRVGSNLTGVLWIIISNIGKDKSFVDDLNMERSIVSVRVGLSYDPLRLSSCSLDLFINWTLLPPFSPARFLSLGRLKNKCYHHGSTPGDQRFNYRHDSLRGTSHKHSQHGSPYMYSTTMHFYRLLLNVIPHRITSDLPISIYQLWGGWKKSAINMLPLFWYVPPKQLAQTLSW